MLNIFVAEDDADDLLLFKQALRSVLPQFNIIHARNGVECIEMLTTQPPPDVIFLDVLMPLKTGIQCLASIKFQTGLAGVPIIMLSTSNSMDDVDASYHAGATLYLVKPPDVKSLAVALKGVFHMLGRPKQEQRIIENFVIQDSHYSHF